MTRNKKYKNTKNYFNIQREYENENMISVFL